MSSSQSWQSLLRTPHPCDHLVQLYTDEAFLERTVTQFIGTGLAAGEAAVIIATPAHLHAFTQRLGVTFGVSAALVRDQLVVLDADACLARLMIDGMPDREAFVTLINGVLDRIQAAGFAKTRLFGEMVNLLCDRNPRGTEALETLWNEVLAARQVSLLCAYRLDNFDRRVHRGLLHQISRTHSHLVPVEDYERFETAVDRAYRDVFGSRGDTATLRELLVSRSPATPVMPEAQAALLALRRVRGDIADAVLERAGAYYAAASVPEPEPASRR